MAAGKAGPTFPLCVGIRMGLVVQKGEEWKIKKMVDRMKDKGKGKRCEAAVKEQWQKNQSCQDTAETV